MDMSTAPLIYQLSLGGSIDPSPFVDADGAAYLVWKADANAGHFGGLGDFRKVVVAERHFDVHV